MPNDFTLDPERHADLNAAFSEAGMRLEFLVSLPSSRQVGLIAWQMESGMEVERFASYDDAERYAVAEALYNCGQTAGP